MRQCVNISLYNFIKLSKKFLSSVLRRQLLGRLYAPEPGVSPFKSRGSRGCIPARH
jgi:hypothetical protein